MAERKRKLYHIYQFSVKDFDKNNCIDTSKLDKEKLELKKIQISESQITELIQAIKGKKYNPNDINFIPELIFIKATNRDKDKLATMLIDGVKIDNIKYVRLGKSASMGRNGVTAFIQEDIAEQIQELITVGKNKQIKEAVISKLEAYKGLCFSTCLFVDVVPENVCIVPEREEIITDYIKSYDIATDEIIEGKYDIKATLHDGMGVHTPKWGNKVANALKLGEVPVAYQIRLFPFTKGMSFEFDFKKFYRERGITTIKDKWGREWEVDKLDAIWSETLFKGKNWFSSWDEFVNLRKKYYKPLGLYNIGIAKWSQSSKQADKMTRMSYQYLQNLALSGGELVDIASYTKDLIEKVYQGDPIYTQIYLGLLAHQNDEDEEVQEDIQDKVMAGKVYQAIMSNPDVMLKDPYVKSFLKRQLKKSIDEMKLGRIYVKGRYSFVCQDPIYFLEYAAGLEPKGCLNKGEFYSTGLEGTVATFRSPLIHSSEVGKLNFIKNILTDKWLKRYDNILVLNCCDLTAQQHGGSDQDGDCFFWTTDERIVNAVITEFESYDKELKQVVTKKNYPVVDVNEGKAKPKKVEVNQQNLLEYDLNTLDNRIGQITNYATYWVTRGSAKGNVNKFDKCLVYLRIAQGMEIDYQKTFVRMEINDKVAQKFKPYFLAKYKYNTTKNIMGDYANTASLNILCKHIEAWEKRTFVWDKMDKEDIIDTSNYLMNKKLMQSNPEESNRIYIQLKDIYAEFRRTLSKLILLARNHNIDDQFQVFFQHYYNKVNQISNNKELLSSIAVYLCYIQEKRNNKTNSYLFPWCCCWEGLLQTLNKKQSPIKRLPERILEPEQVKELDNIFEMLGKRYRERIVVMRVDSNNFIQNQYKKQTERQKDINVKIPLVGMFPLSGQEVAEILEKDNVITLKPKFYTKKGQECETVGLYQQDKYIASISPQYITIMDSNGLIDFRDYYYNNATVTVISVANKSLQVNIKLDV